MKILTWNVERVKKNHNDVLFALQQFGADILILTETSMLLQPPGNDYNFIATNSLPAYHDGIAYNEGENRTTIWSKYLIEETSKTHDSYTSVCAKVITDLGILKIYGTIIGVLGGKGQRFKDDLAANLSDFEIFDRTESLCIAGDFNTMLSGYAYPSHNARRLLLNAFETLDVECVTAGLENNVNHIALSRQFIANRDINIATWNHDKKLSDHIGICLTIT